MDNVEANCNFTNFQFAAESKLNLIELCAINTLN